MKSLVKLSSVLTSSRTWEARFHFILNLFYFLSLKGINPTAYNLNYNQIKSKYLWGHFPCLSTVMLSCMHQQSCVSGKILPTMRDNEFLRLPCWGWRVGPVGGFYTTQPLNPLPPRLINMHPVCEIISIQMSPGSGDRETKSPHFCLTQGLQRLF